MATIVRMPITNVYARGDSTGVILVGPARKPMNVLLDTGRGAVLLPSMGRNTNRILRTAINPPSSRRPIPTARAAAGPAR